MRVLRTPLRDAASLLLTLYLVSGCSADRQPKPAADARASASQGLRFEDGVRSSYALSLTSRVQLSASTALDLALQGQLQVTRLSAGSASAGALLVRVADAQATSSQLEPAAAAALCQELSAGFLIELDGEAPRALRMSATASAFAGNIARTLASALQSGRGSGSTWLAHEQDSVGDYEAEYRASEPGVISKRKLRYTPISLRGSKESRLDLTLTPELVESSGRLLVDLAGLKELSYREQLKTPLLKTGEAIAHNGLSLKLVSRGKATDAPSYAELRDRLPRLPRPNAPVRRQPDAELDASRIGDFTFESAVKVLHELSYGKEPLLLSDTEQETPEAKHAREQRLAEYNRAFSALAALLATEPSALSKATELARKNAHDASFLIDAMAGAESPAAQRALLDLTEPSGASVATQQRAIASLGRIKQPSADTVTALLKWLEADAARSTIAIYGLGSMARGLREREQVEAAGRISSALAAGLTRARRDATRIDYLRGIANTGDAALLPVVLPLLTAPDESVRGAAVEALRLMAHPEVDGHVAERLRHERSYSALRAAVAAARTRGASEPLAEALSEVVLHAPDSQARYRAVQVLADWLAQLPDLRETLTTVARQDPSDDVRGAAQTALDRT